MYELRHFKMSCLAVAEVVRKLTYKTHERLVNNHNKY